MNRIDRLSAILIMLQSSSSVKAKQITDRFDIGIRTVYRDLRALEEAGIPIIGDSKSGYSLVDGFKLPPLMFTQQEAFAFLIAEKLIDSFTDEEFKKDYKSGVDKIKAVLKTSSKETIHLVENRIASVEFHSHANMQSANGYLQILMDSISKHLKVEVVYRSFSQGEDTVRVIDPLGIFFSKDNWYFVGFCNMRNDYRTFRINRIQNISQLQIRFEIHHFEFESYLESLGKQQGLLEVIVELYKKDSYLIDEQKYFQGLIEEIEGENDMVRMRFMVFSLEHFARWYLSYIDVVRIVSPQDLNVIVKSILDKHIDLK